MRTRSFLCLLYLLSLGASLPLASAANDGGLNFRRLSSLDGLSQSVVNAIARDERGFIWCATQDGLNRFDGYSFRTYRHDPTDSTSLSDDFVWRLLVTRSGGLWVATFKGGLCRYNPAEDNFTTFRHAASDPTSLSHDNVTALCEDSHGTIWAGTWFGGLNRLDSADRQRGRFIRYLHDPRDPGSLSDNRIGAIIEDDAGTLWVGTWDGLNKLDRRTMTWTRSMHDLRDRNSLAGNKIWSMARGDAGTFWIGTWGGGLSRYDLSTGTFENYRHDPHQPSGLSSDLLRCVFQDSRGSLWVGTYDAGLDRLDRSQGTFLHYRSDPVDEKSVPDDEIQSIFEDNTGAIWVGTGNGVGVHDRKREKFHLRTLREETEGGYTQYRVRSLGADSSGFLWAGTMGGGLYRLAEAGHGGLRYRNNPDDPSSLSSDLIICLCATRRGELWVGTRGGGLCRLDRTRRVIKRFLNVRDDRWSVALDDIGSLCESRDGTLWVGTNGAGLDRYDPAMSGFVHYRHNPLDTNSISGDWIWSLFEDSRGSLWIGTWGADLSRMSGDRRAITRYRHRPEDSTSLSSNTVVCIVEDRDGFIWFGTTAGLSRYDYSTDRFRRFTVRDGLPNNSINGLLIDDANRLWISTNRGLSRLDARRGVFRNYDVSDGLQGNEFDQGAFARGIDGVAYFGGIGGINIFHPDSIRDNPTVPPVVITGFRVFDRPRPFSARRDDWMTLSHDEDYFSFEYAALDFTAPEKNRYAYMLEGFDREWVDAGTRRYASYTHLDGGDYVFRVKGSNNDGVWNEQGATLNISILPPYWKRSWFRLLAAGAVIGTLFGFYRYRLNRLLVMERTRNRIANDLHDELGATLSGIPYFVEAITGDEENRVTPASRKFLSLIHESATEAQESMSDIIWSINPENDDWKRAFAKFRRYASDLFESKSIQYSIDLPDAIPAGTLEMSRRRHFWLIYKEMVSNIVRHSCCTRAEVRIGLSEGGRHLTLTVSDDGRGFDPDRPTDRNGNKNIRLRAEALKASLQLRTSIGGGTRWELRVGL